MNTYEYVELREGINHRCPPGRINNRVSLVVNICDEGRARLAYDLRGCKWWNVSDLKVVKLSDNQRDAADWFMQQGNGAWFKLREIPFNRSTVESLLFRGIVEQKYINYQSVFRFGLRVTGA